MWQDRKEEVIPHPPPARLVNKSMIWAKKPCNLEWAWDNLKKGKQRNREWPRILCFSSGMEWSWKYWNVWEDYKTWLSSKTKGSFEPLVLIWGREVSELAMIRGSWVRNRSSVVSGSIDSRMADKSLCRMPGVREQNLRKVLKWYTHPYS